jgi:hypothetical protein
VTAERCFPVFVFESLEGLEFDERGYVSGAETLLLDHFDTALRIAEKNNLYVYLYLLVSAHEALKDTKSDWYVNVKDFICDVKARQAYLNNAVKPFALHFKGNKRVFAIDIINESPLDMPDCSWSVMRSFIHANAVAIHHADPSRMVTASVAVENVAQGQVSGLGLNFYDVHRYRNDGELPPVSTLNVKLPVLLGEFAAENKYNIEVDDELSKNAIQKFLVNARDGGYAGAAFWNYDHPNMHITDNLHVIRGDGSSEWRSAAYVLRDFQWERPRIPVKKGPPSTTMKRKH